MRTKYFIFALIFLIALTACVNDDAENTPQTPKPSVMVFNTPTLVPTHTIEPTNTPMAPTATPTLAPISATLKAQINVRNKPSTNGESIGLLNFGTEVMVIGRSTNNEWLTIDRPFEAHLRGWIKAEFINISEELLEDLPVLDQIENEPIGNSTPAIISTQISTSPNTATTAAELNVRSGPASTFSLLGTIPANTTVTLTGKNQTEIWTQVIFEESPSGFGWIASKYLTGGNYSILPYFNDDGNLLNDPESGNSPASPLSDANIGSSYLTPDGTYTPAMLDNDQFNKPGAIIRLGSAYSRNFQFRNSVSSPTGDSEDFISIFPFSTDGSKVVIDSRLNCVGNGGITISLYRENTQIWEPITFTCGNYDYPISGDSGKLLMLKIVADGSAGEIRLVEYLLELQVN